MYKNYVQLRTCARLWLAREWSSTIASVNRTLDDANGLVGCVNHATTADIDSNMLVACTGKDDVTIIELIHGIVPVASSTNGASNGSCSTCAITKEAVIDQTTTVKARSRRSSTPNVWIANASISSGNAAACGWITTATTAGV